MAQKKYTLDGVFFDVETQSRVILVALFLANAIALTAIFALSAVSFTRVANEVMSEHMTVSSVFSALVMVFLLRSVFK